MEIINKPAEQQRIELWQGNEITQARYNFTAMEIDVMSMIFYKVRQSKIDSLQYSFSFEEFKEKTGLKSSNLFQLKKAVKSLQQKTFEYNTSKDVWFSAPLVAGVKIDTKEDLVTFNIDVFIKPLITEIVKNTTRYFLDTIFALDGKHSKRFYHYFSMYKNIGKFICNYSDLKNKLLEEDKYTYFSAFEKKVILPALNEINEVSELKVNYRVEKKYGGDNKLVFFIEEKKGDFKDEKTNLIYELLKKSNLAEWFIQNSIKVLSTEKIYELHYTASTRARNKGAYLRKLLVEHGVPQTKI